MYVDRIMNVQNYVGTYDMVKKPGYKSSFIVSREFMDAREDETELPYREIINGFTKTDYISSYKKSDKNKIEPTSLFLAMAQVDVDSDDSILSFCNRYGLPLSDACLFEKEANIDGNTDLNYRAVSHENGQKIFQRKDYIERTEFCISAVRVKYLVDVKSILDSGITKDTAGRLLEGLIYLLFYSRALHYQYTAEDPLPITRCMRLQYYYQLNKKHLLAFDAFRGEKETILKYLDYIYKYMTENTPVIPHLNTWQGIIYTNAENPRYATQFDDIGSDVYSKEGKKICEFFWELFHETQIDFSANDYYQLNFSQSLSYHGDLERLKEIAKIVYTDTLNELVLPVRPKLSIDPDGKIWGDWRVNFQEHGMYMEMFIATAAESQIRKCANPTCGNYFSVSEGRADKKYCSVYCAQLQAKRKLRAKIKKQKMKANG